MLQLPNDITLTPRSTGYMIRWQTAINDEPDYQAQIKKAKATWGKSNKTFDEIKEKLRLMSNNTSRCNYCEDSVADEIEHIYPKDIYPDRTFVWENYLYSCGHCNLRKSNNFALINPGGNLNDITPPKPLPDDHVFVRPPNNQIAFIDPRIENPTDFIELDIIDTFRFVPAIELNETDENYIRAQYTIDVLQLNDREFLVQARRTAYQNFRARLREYIQQRNDGANQADLDELINGIQEENHKTVWREMVRFNTLIPTLNELFQEAPEAVDW